MKNAEATRNFGRNVHESFFIKHGSPTKQINEGFIQIEQMSAAAGQLK